MILGMSNVVYRCLQKLCPFYMMIYLNSLFQDPCKRQEIEQICWSLPLIARKGQERNSAPGYR